MIASSRTEGRPQAYQRAYLEAMDIPVWVSRETLTVTVPATDCLQSLQLGPGNGGILLICATDSDVASKLANDISRSLSSVPVWSWPDSGADTVKPAVAVEEHLFTTIAVFGTQLAEQLFGHTLPKRLNSASLILLPSMRDLETCAPARQTLWTELCSFGLVSAN